MIWANFLHIYQPADQSDEILERVVNECYRPLFRGLLTIKNLKININMNAGLTELLDKKGYQDVIEAIYKLAKTKKLEFTESAKYHALLPFLTEEEIIRQIKENNKTNKKYFKETYNPKCFFPPEMAYSPKVGKVISSLGYPLIMVDGISYQGGKTAAPKDKLFFLAGTKTITIFRERSVSNCIMSALVKNKKDFYEILGNEIDKNIYLTTAMDGETFGHHRPGLEKSLFKILSLKKPKQVFLSQLPEYFRAEDKFSPLASTWASTSEDMEKNLQFFSWDNLHNKVHRLQWSFLNYVRSLTKKRKYSDRVLEKFDKSIASDQFFWASGEPWWSVEMIEKGAWGLLESLKLLSKNKKEIEKGEKYYRDILSIAFWWQRSGKIGLLAKKYKEAVRIPFKERTLMVGGESVYKRVNSLIKRKMLEAAKNKNYERAILWRDAIWKLETKNDIYDLMHVVDLLRMELPDEFKELDPKLNELFIKYKEKYRKVEPGQPESRKVWL